VFADGAYSGAGADYAEYISVAQDRTNYEEGDVIAFSGEMLFDKSTTPNSSAIAGVYSTNPVVIGNNSSGCCGVQADMTSGTAEGSSWVTLTVGDDPDGTNYNQFAIDGNRVADYAVDTRIRLDTGISAKVTASNWDTQQNKTIVVFNQHLSADLNSTEATLYHGVQARNVIPMSMLGQVPVKCITENGTISPGDLVVTSSTVGHAMKAGGSPAIGTILGKAMETLTDTGGGNDIGVITVYVNLQ